jgi:hypothetical protein
VQWRLDYAVCERLFDLIQQQIVFFTYSKGGKLEANVRGPLKINLAVLAMV